MSERTMSIVLGFILALLCLGNGLAFAEMVSLPRVFMSIANLVASALFFLGTIFLVLRDDDDNDDHDIWDQQG